MYLFILFFGEKSKKLTFSCQGVLKGGETQHAMREILASGWSKIWLFFFFFQFLSFPPPLLKLYPPISCSLLPSMKNASFIWGLGLACLELIESTPLKCVIKWWMDQNGDPRHSTACDWKCFSSMFTVVLGSVGLKLKLRCSGAGPHPSQLFFPFSQEF